MATAPDPAIEDEPDDIRGNFISPFGILLKIASSPVSRFGIFSRQEISPGTRIIEYVGEHISHEEGNLRDEKYDADFGMIYVFELNDSESIDGVIDGNQSVYVNHSCDPNCQYVIENGHIYFDSIKPIKIGDELSYDYKCAANPDPIPCQCGSPLCRGTINLTV